MSSYICFSKKTFVFSMSYVQQYHRKKGTYLKIFVITNIMIFYCEELTIHR